MPRRGNGVAPTCRRDETTGRRRRGNDADANAGRSESAVFRRAAYGVGARRNERLRTPRVRGVERSGGKRLRRGGGRTRLFIRLGRRRNERRLRAGAALGGEGRGSRRPDGAVCFGGDLLLGTRRRTGRRKSGGVWTRGVRGIPTFSGVGRRRRDLSAKRALLFGPRRRKGRGEGDAVFGGSGEGEPSGGDVYFGLLAFAGRRR